MHQFNSKVSLFYFYLYPVYPCISVCVCVYVCLRVSLLYLKSICLLLFYEFHCSDCRHISRRILSMKHLFRIIFMGIPIQNARRHKYPLFDLYVHPSAIRHPNFDYSPIFPTFFIDPWQVKHAQRTNTVSSTVTSSVWNWKKSTTPRTTSRSGEKPSWPPRSICPSAK